MSEKRAHGIRSAPAVRRDTSMLLNTSSPVAGHSAFWEAESCASVLRMLWLWTGQDSLAKEVSSMFW